MVAQSHLEIDRCHRTTSPACAVSCLRRLRTLLAVVSPHQANRSRFQITVPPDQKTGHPLVASFRLGAIARHGVIPFQARVLSQDTESSYRPVGWINDSGSSGKVGHAFSFQTLSPVAPRVAYKPGWSLGSSEAGSSNSYPAVWVIGYTATAADPAGSPRSSGTGIFLRALLWSRRKPFAARWQ